MPGCLSRACLLCQAHTPYMYTYHIQHMRYTICEGHAHVLALSMLLKASLAWVWCRCIQRADQPIILTGFSALNKLLGREVYSSQMQLGGPKVIRRSQTFVRCEQIIVHITAFYSYFYYYYQYSSTFPCMVPCPLVLFA